MFILLEADNELKMKTITLTDDQFDTLFEFVDQKVEYIVDKSIDYQDSEILKSGRLVKDVHTVIEEVNDALTQYYYAFQFTYRRTNGVTFYVP